MGSTTDVFAELTIPGDFTRFTNPYTPLAQWPGNDLRSLQRTILPILAAAFKKPTPAQKVPPRQALLGVKYLVGFQLMAKYGNHTSEMLHDMSIYPKRFCQHIKVFQHLRAGKAVKKMAEGLWNPMQEEKRLA